MRLLRDAPIKQKLYAIILFTAATVLLIGLIMSVVFKVAAARDEGTARLQALASVLGANSRAALAFRDPETAAEVLETLSTQEDVAWAFITLPAGGTFARYTAHGMDETAGEDDNGVLGRYLFRLLRVNQPIVLDGRVIGNLTIAGDMRRMRSTLGQEVFLAFALFIGSMFLALLLTIRLQRIISEPVRRLRDAMGAVGSTRNFSRRAERVSNDELGSLTDGFNEMLGQLKAYDDELAGYRQDLESQVRLRTRELENAKQKAEAASLAKSDFLATMSHEIRTPMTGVIGFTGLLEKTALDTKQRDYTRIISSSARSLLDIIDDILDFSKMEAGKVELETQDFDLERLLADVRMLFSPKAIDKGLTLTTSIAHDVPTILNGDPVRFRQILTNVLGNAVKFTDRGQIDLHIEPAPARGQRIGLVVTLSDTGIGIPPDQQEKLFQPFEQGDGSITRRYGGTGLGLVITQRLVDLMDGEISVYSVPGQGSSFTIAVYFDPPAAPSLLLGEHRDAAAASKVPATSPSDEGAGAADLAGLRILVVDDSIVNLTLAEALLNDRQMRVVAVDSGDEALAVAGTERFDLILMDLEMPEMSGMDVARKLREPHRSTREVPIVAVTAHAFPEKRREVIEAGMNDLLAKPYLPDQLYAIVEKWCGGEMSTDVARLDTTVVGDPDIIFDREAALALTDGNEDLAASMLLEFLNRLPETELVIRDAATDHDYSRLLRQAHKLAGSSAAVGASRVQAQATYLQSCLELAPVPEQQVVEGVADLLKELERFRDAAGPDRGNAKGVPSDLRKT